MTAHDEPASPSARDHAHEHGPNDPYCVDAIRSLYLYLDRELGHEEVAVVEAHLHECSPCFEAYDFEAEFRMVISTRGRAPMPPDVLQRLQHLVQELGTGGPAAGGDLPAAGGNVPGPGPDVPRI